jgi:pyruvate kinase
VSKFRKIKAKIIATIGPASASPQVLKKLIRSGMDAARLNFSHGNQREHSRAISEIRRLSTSLKQPVSIIADLPGPKIRSGKLAGGIPIQLRAGDSLVLAGGDITGTRERVGITYPKLAREVRRGDRILLADGLIELKVRGTRRGEVNCTIVNGGALGERKGVNLPGVKLSISAVTPADRKHLDYALGQGVDYIAESFVRNAGDVRTLKNLIRRSGSDVPVFAKIEKPEAVDNLAEILEVADGIMVARGDLGVEMSPEEVPVAQKKIIAAANAARLPVITATQMLESMIENPRPTRAEASDVANAIYDGSDAVMLSGETATGRYPTEAVQMMVKIIAQAEAAQETKLRRRRFEVPSVPETIAEIAADAADLLDTSAVVVFTASGYSARLVSKARPGPPIVAFAHREDVRRRLALLWGVHPRKIRRVRKVDDLIQAAGEMLLKEKLVARGDTIAIVAGTPLDVPGTTNLLKIHTVE